MVVKTAYYEQFSTLSNFQQGTTTTTGIYIGYLPGKSRHGGSMGSKTGIEWTDSTWNPTIGCSRVSEGCRYCYAERLAHRSAFPEVRA